MLSICGFADYFAHAGDGKLPKPNGNIAAAVPTSFAFRRWWPGFAEMKTCILNGPD
jgi:hypothetical protein